MNMKSVVVVTHGDALRLGPPEAASHRAELWTPPGPERPNGHRLGWTTASAAPPVRPHDEPGPTTSPAQPSARPNTARPNHRPGPTQPGPAIGPKAPSPGSVGMLPPGGGPTCRKASS